MKRLLIILPVLFCLGATYYVDTTGSDAADGSVGTPWLTVRHAATNVLAGDLVLVNSGVYSNVVYLRSSGSSESPITFRATGDVTNKCQWYVAASHLVIDGFDFIGWGSYELTKSAVSFGEACTNVTIQNCHFHDNPGGWTGAIKGDTTNVANVVISNNVFSDWGALGDGMIITSGMRDVVIANNTLSNTFGADAIRPFGTGITVRSNRIVAVGGEMVCVYGAGNSDFNGLYYYSSTLTADWDRGTVHTNAAGYAWVDGDADWESYGLSNRICLLSSDGLTTYASAALSTSTSWTMHDAAIVSPPTGGKGWLDHPDVFQVFGPMVGGMTTIYAWTNAHPTITSNRSIRVSAQGNYSITWPEATAETTNLLAVFWTTNVYRAVPAGYRKFVFRGSETGDADSTVFWQMWVTTNNCETYDITATSTNSITVPATNYGQALYLVSSNSYWTDAAIARIGIAVYQVATGSGTSTLTFTNGGSATSYLTTPPWSSGNISSNVLIECNYIQGNSGGALGQLVNQTGHQNNPSATVDWTLRNNVIIGLRLLSNYARNLRFYNNTFYRCGASNTHPLDWEFGNPYDLDVADIARGEAYGGVAMNNAFVTCGGYGIDNCGWYYRIGYSGMNPPHDAKADFNYVVNTTNTWSQKVVGTYAFESYKFYEAHGVNGGDPKFADVGGFDFRIDADSVLVTGTNLSSLGFTTDYTGGTRSNWSIGAFEYGATYPSTTRRINATRVNAGTIGTP
jgi:hypothetical protein